MNSHPDFSVLEGGGFTWTTSEDAYVEMGEATAEAVGFTRAESPPPELYVRRAGKAVLRMRLRPSEDAGVLTYSDERPPWPYHTVVKIFLNPVQSRGGT